MLCTKAGHARPLLIPARGRAGPAAAADDRWALVARLLHEDTIDFTDRVAALLLPLYVQQLSRIAAMTTGQITTQGQQVFVRFGRDDVLILEPLAGLLITRSAPDAIASDSAHQPPRTGYSPA